MAVTTDIQFSECRLALALKAQLGEGLHWDARAQRLWGVDIHGMLIWRWDLPSDTPERWQLSQRVGWVIPVAGSDRILLGLQGGFALAAAADPVCFDWVARPFADNPALRLNDAKADATGAVWAGSLNNDDESRADGRLYRLGTDRNLVEIDSGYTVANGPAINADSTLMLHTDSGRRTIYAFDLDAKLGRLSHKRVWKVFEEAEGYPDGMCFDAEGCVWVAHWGAGCISRFAADGRLLRRISLPVSNVTNVCFGGPALDRLFVTSARVGLSATQLAGEPLAGSLFEIVSPAAKGLPCLSYGRS